MGVQRNKPRMSALCRWVLLLVACLGISVQAVGILTEAEVLAPGDLMRVTMHEDPDVKFEGAVSAAGTILIPYLGEFPVVNLTPRESELELAKALQAELYQRATVSVILVKKAPGQVYVYGAVKKPGVVQMPEVGGLTILQLISQVNGLTSWASPSETFILRRSRPSQPAQKIKIQLAEIFANALPGTDADLRLRSNDVICIPGISGGLFEFISADKCEVMVVGEVKTPGIVEFASGEERTLLRAIFKAGGFDKFAKSSAVRLISYGRNRQRMEKTIDVSAIIDDGLLEQDFNLKPGDMLIVPAKRLNF
jgi:protein involved in polysaccharide export with SLBB domain